MGLCSCRLSVFYERIRDETFRLKDNYYKLPPYILPVFFEKETEKIDRFLMVNQTDRFESRETPTIVSCWQVFEPKILGGHLIVSSGFSVQAEHAHQNQGRFPFYDCWTKEHLPITNTAGVVHTR